MKNALRITAVALCCVALSPAARRAPQKPLSRPPKLP